MLGRRTIQVSSLAVALVLSLPTPGLGWANGPNGCNSFGTHDWILREALDATDVGWVRRRVALRATDDPDCRDGIEHASSPWWHVYDIWGNTYGDAPEAAQVWFRKAKNRLAAGNERGASKALGYLAHIVGDVAQPMHTDQRDREERVHSSYESAVDTRLDRYTSSYDGRDGAKPFRRTVRVATVAHKHYFELVRTYDDRGYTRRVHRITRRQLDRAVNAVADLITKL